MYTKQHQQLLSKYKNEYIPTKEEDLFESILKEYNVRYIKQKGFVSKCHTCLIADFYIPKPHKLIIEIDGGYHLTRLHKDYGRDQFFLKERKIKTIRFTNDDVLNNKEYVKNTLSKVLRM